MEKKVEISDEKLTKIYCFFSQGKSFEAVLLNTKGKDQTRNQKSQKKKIFLNSKENFVLNSFHSREIKVFDFRSFSAHSL